jgi:hypothetical protein
VVLYGIDPSAHFFKEVGRGFSWFLSAMVKAGLGIEERYVGVPLLVEL